MGKEYTKEVVGAQELRIYKILLLLVIGVNALGLFNIIFTGDSALYATISKSISTSGNYLDLYVAGEDWLDKPHFPFWVCALSMKLLGASTFAYKLPSFVFFLVALFYTFRLGRELYTDRVGWISAIIFGSALHIIISNNDVRAEAILVGVIMGGVYHMHRWGISKSVVHLLLAGIFSACAIMTKGVFVLIILYSAVLGDLLIRDPRSIFSWKWPVLLFITGIFTLPEIYALYHQFDLHPEKVVFGETGVSGVRFFIWDSQFGRFFNTGPIKGKGDPFFFVHTFLWAFAPWAFVAFLPLVQSVKDVLRKKKNREYITFFGFSIMFLVFSVSRFQLPHYTNILFPFISILTAQYLAGSGSSAKFSKRLSTYSIVLSVLLIVAVLGVQFIFAPGKWVLFGILLTGFILILIVLRAPSHDPRYLSGFGILVLSVLFVGGYVNTIFYPKLLTSYQAGYTAAKYVNSLNTDLPLVTLEKDWTLAFYANGKLEYGKEYLEENRGEMVYIYGSEEAIQDIDTESGNLRELKSFPYFHITKMNGRFIHSATREETLKKKKVYIMEPK